MDLGAPRARATAAACRRRAAVRSAPAGPPVYYSASEARDESCHGRGVAPSTRCRDDIRERMSESVSASASDGAGRRRERDIAGLAGERQIARQPGERARRRRLRGRAEVLSRAALRRAARQRRGECGGGGGGSFFRARGDPCARGAVVLSPDGWAAEVTGSASERRMAAARSSGARARRPASICSNGLGSRAHRSTALSVRGTAPRHATH